MRASQTGLYSTSSGSGSGSGSGVDDDDMLDAMLAGMETDFKVSAPVPPTPRANAVIPDDIEELLVSSSEVTEAVPETQTGFVGHSVDIKKRIEALCNTSLWNVASMPFIYGVREGISIINLEHTLTYLRRACTVAKTVAGRGGIILFIGTRENMQHVTIDAAKSCNAYYVSSKWCPGTITNAQEIIGPHTPRLPDARPGDLPKPSRPDLVIVLNPIENQIAIKEATQFNIPTIAITDTDVDPRVVSYPIPGNDDSVRGVELVAKVLAEAIKEGNDKAAEFSQKFAKQRIEERVDRLKESGASA
ncbi:37S ribosomal protein, mitochondrial [Lunasporangiospora selenospora]|uniref:37S ribosomal protein, mitochondrial n=1 Tax=Lunasporangiospora selenospora TaxID=979761 RepID=A0A9P6G0J5_9FUNG|nr:37S ribosomal protein, mitochondrial [Lunasporangiospora selenospora]